MQVSPFILITGGGEIVVALLFALYWKRKHSIPWGFFGWGALAWVAGVAVKFAVGFLTSDAAFAFLEQTFPKHIADPLFRLCLGSLDGVLMMGAALLFAAITRVRNADSNQAVAFGTGFRSLEVLLVAFYSLGGTLMDLHGPPEGDMPSWGMSPLHLPPDSMWLWVAVGPVERVLTIIVHIFSAALAVYAWRTKRWGYLMVSVLYKTAVDTLGAFGMMSYGALEELSRI